MDFEKVFLEMVAEQGRRAGPGGVYILVLKLWDRINALREMSPGAKVTSHCMGGVTIQSTDTTGVGEWASWLYGAYRSKPQEAGETPGQYWFSKAWESRYVPEGKAHRLWREGVRRAGLLSQRSCIVCGAETKDLYTVYPGPYWPACSYEHADQYARGLPCR